MTLNSWLPAALEFDPNLRSQVSAGPAVRADEPAVEQIKSEVPAINIFGKLHLQQDKLA